MMIEKKIIQVSLVVQLIDEFTDQVVRGQGVQLHIEGAAKPIRKEDGSYVFTNIKEDKVLLQLSSPIYQEEKLPLELSSGEVTMIQLRIKPNRNYSFPAGTTIIEGEAERGSLVIYYQTEGKECFKLLFDATKQGKNMPDALSIYNPDDKNLDGRMFVIVNEGDKKEELIQIQEESSEHPQEYLLKKALQHEFKKLGTKLFPVSSTRADDKGRFLLPVHYTQKITKSGVLELHGNKLIQRQVSLVEGQSNWMKLAKENR